MQKSDIRERIKNYTDQLNLVLDEIKIKKQEVKKTKEAIQLRKLIRKKTILRANIRVYNNLFKETKI